MSTPWEVANKCPRDGAFTGKVLSRKAAPGGGQLIMLQCPEDNCEYHGTGWIVQTRPDGSIPDAVDVNTREKMFSTVTLTEAKRQQIRDVLAQQVLAEQKPGYEVHNV